MPYNLKNKVPIPKAEARKIVRERAGDLTGFDLKNKSAIIIERLINSDDFSCANKIFGYYYVSEYIVDIKSLINIAQGQGKSVFLPKKNRTGTMREDFSSQIMLN